MKLEDVMRKVGELEVSACISGMHGAATCTHAQAIADVRAAILKYGRAQRERANRIVSTYQVPVGNSAAGEIAAEMTMEALREIRDAIRSLPDEEA